MINSSQPMPDWFRDLGAAPVLLRGLYYFLLALVLALLEIQIEGPHGWAVKLPTWRWQSARVLRWVGKPVTGYHVCMISFILLSLHLPLVYTGWSWARHAEILSFFFLISVFWDFQWFLLNPHFGWARFRPGIVWWFPRWWGGFPADYSLGLAASLALFLTSKASLSKVATWGLSVLEFGVLTLLSYAVFRPRRSPDQV